MLPPAPALTAAPTRVRLDLSETASKLYRKYAVGFAMKPSDRRTAFDGLPMVNSRFASLPVVEPAVVAALRASRHQYAAQDAHLRAVQQTVVETTGLLAIIAQALETGDVGSAQSYLAWAMQANAMSMHELTVLRREKVLSLLGVREATLAMPSVRSTTIADKEKVVSADQSEAPPLFGKRLTKEAVVNGKDNPLADVFGKLAKSQRPASGRKTGAASSRRSNGRPHSPSRKAASTGQRPQYRSVFSSRLRACGSVSPLCSASIPAVSRAAPISADLSVHSVHALTVSVNSVAMSAVSDPPLCEISMHEQRVFSTPCLDPVDPLFVGGLKPAGQLRLFVNNWRKITRDPWVISAIMGYRLDFLPNAPVEQHVQPRPIRFSSTERLLVDAEVDKLIAKGAAKEVPEHRRRSLWLSRIFLVPKKSGE